MTKSTVRKIFQTIWFFVSAALVGVVVPCTVHIIIKFGFEPIKLMAIAAIGAYPIALAGGLIAGITAKNQNWRSFYHFVAVMVVWMVGCFVGAVGFALVLNLHTFHGDLSSLTDVLDRSRCQQDNHNCLGDGALLFGIFLLSFIASIPGALIGGELGRQSYIALIKIFRGRRSLPNR